MKNGIRSNKLMMVDGSGREIGSSDSMDDAAADYAYAREMESSVLQAGQSAKTTLIVLTAVSAVCTAAAISSGSYALWLAKRSSTHEVLTDVNDILKTCQSRMRQLESEVQLLPGRASQKYL